MYMYVNSVHALVHVQMYMYIQCTMYMYTGLYVCVLYNVHVHVLVLCDVIFLQCNTVNFSRRRFCMTCDCPRSGEPLHTPCMQCLVEIITCSVCVCAESDQLHEDVRSGKDSGRVEDNAPSNGKHL